MAEQLICNQQVVGSTPIASSILEGFPSGQRGWTVNPLAELSMVRIHLPPPISFLRKWLRGRASPCQGEGREFESRLPLHQKIKVELVRPFLFFEPVAVKKMRRGENNINLTPQILV